jgi:hypothetical protein
MKTIQDKILAKQYPSRGVAAAVVRRSDISPQARNKLLALVEQAYAQKPAPVEIDGIGREVTNRDPVDVTIVQPPMRRIDLVSKYPITAAEAAAKLDQQLLKIAFQLLGLCIEHKLSREEMCKRLEVRLMAGMG